MRQKIIFILGIIGLLIPLACLADDDSVALSSRVNEAQAALNVKGFDAASIFGTTFQDSISPHTGALTITQTDAFVKGRNGHDFVLTRQYSSNIFLNMNHMGGGINYPCGGNGFGTNSVCDNCITPANIYGIKVNSDGTLGGGFSRLMNKCSDSSLKAASFKREKYLGRGWTLNYLENRLKDPTPLIMQVGVPTYEYLSEMGITSMSLVADNNEQEIILPSMFKKNLDNRLSIPLFIANAVLWNYQVAYVEEYTGTGNIYRDQHRLIKHFNDILNDEDDDLAQFYMAYTTGLEPILMGYAIDVSPAPLGVIPQATYYRSDGVTFYYDHYVPFCQSYDDLKKGDFCASSSDDDPETHWAENPYAGVYPSRIVDQFGNEIAIAYNQYGFDKSPFIDHVQLRSAQVDFVYDTPENKIDKKLQHVEYPGGDGSSVYRIYNYKTINGADLLENTYLSNSSTGAPIAGTKYEFDYAQDSQELVEVKLPTGATINYVYGWAEEMPALDAVRGQMDSTSPYNDMPRRVVVERTITNGGECNGMQYCTWQYRYKKEGDSLVTTVIDPFNKQTKYYMYPATTTTLNHYS